MKEWLISLLFLVTQAAPAQEWPDRMPAELTKALQNFKGELGLYVKDLDSGKTFSHNGETWWYLASVIKVVVLIEVFRQIEAGKLSLEQKVTVNKSDYRDGAGKTNWLEPGSVTNVRFLVEQMMHESDNAATDLLIGLVGLENVNRNLKALNVAGKMNDITSMLEVRRLAFSELHDKARELTNMDFFEIKKAGRYPSQLRKFLKLTKTQRSELKATDVVEAFERYYQHGLNGGTLESFASILEQLVNGKVINAKRSQEILDIMSKCRTGKERLRAGIPTGANWMNKTGTQVNRLCDAGVAIMPATSSQPARRLAIVACVKGYGRNSAGDVILKKTAQALLKAGAFDHVAP